MKCNELEKYHIKEFYGEDVSWKRFICCNRWYDGVISHNPNEDNNIDLRYDIVIGLTADGKMGQLGRLIKRDNYMFSDEFLKYLTPFRTKYSKIVNNKQKVFHTKAYQISIHNKIFLDSCIKYNGYDIIRIENEDGNYE